jgi:tRNA(Ile)-lysidine synthase
LDEAEEIDFSDPLTAWLDYDKVKENKLFVRYRRRGDAFHPSGMEGKKKKLQDFFTDKKVSSKLRDSVPLLVTEKDDIVWVVGMRVDERFLLNKNSKKALRIKYYLNK